MRLNEILEALGLAAVTNDTQIEGLNTLKEATNKHLSFFNKQKQLQELKDTKAAAVFVYEKDASFVPQNTEAIIVDDPYLYLAYSSKFFAHNHSLKSTKPVIGMDCKLFEGVHFGDGVTIGNNVTIMPGSYIGDNVTVADNTFIHPNVTIYHGCEIGKDCIIHSGAVIGSDGYGFATKADKTHVKIYQNGNVIVQDCVEIGANCTVDRAVFNATVIKKGTKLDNLIHIGHNCEIGQNNFFAAQVGLSGSTITGDNIMMGGQAGTAGHLSIADYSVIAARGGVTKDIKKPGYYAGFPLMDGKLWLKLQAKLARLLKA